MNNPELLEALKRERDAKLDNARKFREELHQAEHDYARSGVPFSHGNSKEEDQSLHNFATNTEDTRGMNYGYARILSIDKNPAIQLEALQKAGCDEIFKDEGIDATIKNRPALLRCLKTLEPGDTLTVSNLARLGRSARDLADIGNKLLARGAALCSLRENINTASPCGELTFQFFAAMAQFQRDLSTEHMRAGLKQAREEHGLKTGPERKLSPEQIEQARKRIAHGERPKLVAHDYEISRTTLWTYLNIKNDTPGNAESIPPTPPRRAKAVSSPRNH